MLAQRGQRKAVSLVVFCMPQHVVVWCGVCALMSFLCCFWVSFWCCVTPQVELVGYSNYNNDCCMFVHVDIFMHRVGSLKHLTVMALVVQIQVLMLSPLKFYSAKFSRLKGCELKQHTHDLPVCMCRAAIQQASRQGKCHTEPLCKCPSCYPWWAGCRATHLHDWSSRRRFGNTN